MPSVALDITIALVGHCITSYQAFHSLQDECRSFREFLLTVRGVLQGFKDDTSFSSLAGNTKMDEPLRLLINAVKEGKEILEACTSVKKVRTLVFSKDYLSRLGTAANKINSALTLLIAARSCSDDQSTQRKMDDVNRGIENLKIQIQTNNHEAEAVICGLMKAEFQSVRGLFEIMTAQLQSLAIVTDKEDLKQQIREIQKENSASEEKAMYNQQLLEAVLALSRKESEEELPLIESDGDDDDHPSSNEPIIETSPESSPETDASRRHREQQSSILSLLSCPLSLDIMKDPVVLVDSGTTYDREFLCKSLLAYPNLEPCTNERFDKKLSFTSNIVVRRMLMETYGDHQYQPYDDSDFRQQYEEAWQAHHKKKWGSAALKNGKPSSRFTLDSKKPSSKFSLNQIVENADLQIFPVTETFGNVNITGAGENIIVFAKSKPEYNDSSPAVPPDVKRDLYKTEDEKETLYAELADLLFGASLFKGESERAQNILLQLSREDAISEAYRGLLLGKTRKDERAKMQTHWRNATSFGLDALAITGNKWAKILKAAQFRLGLNEKTDDIEASRLFEEAANQGNAVAQFCLGHMYKNGHGVDQNFENAIELYKKASAQGNLSAMCSLALMYCHGKGCTKNEDEAFINFWAAAEEGHSLSQFHLGMAYEIGMGTSIDYSQAEEYYLPSIKQGNFFAMYRLGLIYLDGADGIERNVSEAILLLRRAAELGHPDAQYKMGTTYYDGSHVTKDAVAALSHFEKAAMANHGGAMQKLAGMYDQGDCVDKDKERANELYELAIERGCEGRPKGGSRWGFFKRKS